MMSISYYEKTFYTCFRCYKPLVKQSFWDDAGNPFILSEGYHAIIWVYDDKGNLVEQYLLDEKDNKVADENTIF